MSGRNDKRSTTTATVLNLGMGSQTKRTIAAKTSTAQVTSAAVSTTGGNTPSGRKVDGGCKTATAMSRTKKTTAVEANTVNGPSQIRRRINKYTNETWFLTIPPLIRAPRLRGRVQHFENLIDREPLDSSFVSVARRRRREGHAV